MYIIFEGKVWRLQMWKIGQRSFDSFNYFETPVPTLSAYKVLCRNIKTLLCKVYKGWQNRKNVKTNNRYYLAIHKLDHLHRRLEPQLSIGQMLKVHWTGKTTNNKKGFSVVIETKTQVRVTHKLLHNATCNALPIKEMIIISLKGSNMCFEIIKILCILIKF